LFNSLTTFISVVLIFLNTGVEQMRTDILEQIQRLVEELYRQGILSEEEIEKFKKDVFGSKTARRKRDKRRYNQASSNG